MKRTQLKCAFLVLKNAHILITTTPSKTSNITTIAQSSPMRLQYIVGSISTLFFFIVEGYFVMITLQFINSPVYWLEACFQFLTVINNTAVKIPMHVFRISLHLQAFSVSSHKTNDPFSLCGRLCTSDCKMSLNFRPHLDLIDSVECFYFVLFFFFLSLNIWAQMERIKKRK